MSAVGVKAIVTSGRTLKQGRAMEIGKLSSDYFKEVSVCEMDKATFEVLGIEEGDSVRVETIHGEVIVKSRLDRRAEPGVMFIPCGPYANAITGADTEGTGMPDYKSIEAQVFAAKGKSVLSVKELLAKMVEGS
ncbi:MAG: molybdopterin dinucleotide binding domain-containing protein [Candidatus Thorarchaeota archaeon]|jgi:formylmethanofuran dehydrogenase subunit D